MMRQWIWVLLFLGLLGPHIIVASPDVEKDKMESLQRQIQENEQKLEEKKRKKQKLAYELAKTQRNISWTHVQLKRADNNLDRYHKQAQASTRRIQQMGTQFEKQKASFSNLLVSVYKHRHLGFLEFLFSPKDFEMALHSSYVYERALKGDLAFIDKTKGDYQQLLNEKQRLASLIKRGEDTKLSIEKNQTYLSKVKTRQAKIQRVLKRDIQKIESENKELLKISQDMGLLIRGKSKRIVVGTLNFIKPVAGWISSRFGYRRHPILKRRLLHTGMDFAAPTGYRIRASDSGIIIFAGRWGGYGNATIIDHGQNITSVYAHQSRIVVRKGDTVNKGQVIGYVGSTGYSTGPHLHFEIRKYGKPVNPSPYIRG
ncbi:MAG: peptidoglycan DD-metalloendopeptidase family protein [Candidatus Margulisbacteria bacterium]|nr:peptidoglycan DD-metalloendopeptidase family protein [Candidatus Margulisiibacteriota bacterium]